MKNMDVKKKIIFAVLLLITVQCGLRLWVIARSPALGPDAGGYLLMAIIFQDPQPSEVITFHPGYSWCVSQVVGLLPESWGENMETWIWTGRLISMVCNVLFLLGGWFLLCQLFPGKLWLCYWSVFLWGASRGEVFLGSEALTDAMAFALQVWALGLLLWGLGPLRKKRQWIIYPIGLICGVLLGWAAWVNLLSAIAGVFAIGLCLLRAIQWRTFSTVGVGTLIILGGFFTAPSLAKNLLHLKQKGITSNVQKLIGHETSTQTPPQNSPSPRGVKKAPAEKPQRLYDSQRFFPVEKLPCHESVIVQLPYQFFCALFPIFGLGLLLFTGEWLFAKWKKQPWRPICGLPWTAASLVLLYVTVIGLRYAIANGISQRYFHLAVLMVLPLSLQGFLLIYQAISIQRLGRWIGLGFGIACLMLILWHSTRPINQNMMWTKKTANYLNKHDMVKNHYIWCDDRSTAFQLFFLKPDILETPILGAYHPSGIHAVYLGRALSQYPDHLIFSKPLIPKDLRPPRREWLSLDDYRIIPSPEELHITLHEKK